MGIAVQNSILFHYIYFVMNKENQVIVVGGGLAGLTAAIHLAKAGIEVTVVEKDGFPRHKVCGEYISNEVLPYLDWLGVNLAQLNPTAITQFQFSTLNGRSTTTELPLGGFGISRYALDAYLYKKAVENGCKIIQDAVVDIAFDETEFTLTTDNSTVLKSKIVLGAFGKRSKLDQKLNRSFVIQRRSPWLAVKAHYSGHFPDDLVGLHNFKGGYCGISKVENDIINVCYLTDYESFKEYRNIADFQENVLAVNPHLAKILSDCKPVFEKALTISQISFEKKEAVENHMLMIGDAAGLIHPLCGNGMAMAIHSAKIGAELTEKFCSGEIKSRAELEEKYKQEWEFNFKKRIKAGRLLSKFMQKQRMSEVLLGIFIQFPFLLKMIIKKTHGKPILINRF